MQSRLSKGGLQLIRRVQGSKTGTSHCRCFAAQPEKAAEDDGTSFADGFDGRERGEREVGGRRSAA